MATLRRLPYAVINIWCPYGYIAKIALYHYIWWSNIANIVLYLMMSVFNIAKIAFAVIYIWCPYGNIANIVLYRHKYLMSVCQHCEDCLIPL